MTQSYGSYGGNTPQFFCRRARLFHTIVGALIIILLAVGLSFDLVPKGNLRSIMMSTHKLLGFVTLWLVLLWWVEYVVDPKPLRPEKFSNLLYYLSLITKGLLLLCATVMPLSGWLMTAAESHTDLPVYHLRLPSPIAADPTLGRLLGQVHETTAWILLGGLTLHILGALYHHVIRRDDILHRMFPFIARP